tara:strand:+ start:28 stop:579 length:552 start_codon:yes stop_codon:yes gene_type:complete
MTDRNFKPDSGTDLVFEDAGGTDRLRITDGGTTILYDEGGSTALTVETGGDVTIKGDTFDAAYADYYSSPSCSIVGWISLVAGRRQIYYKKMGTIVNVCCHLEGTSDATTVTFTVPYNFITTDYMSFMSQNVWCYDNGTADSGPGRFVMDSNTNICKVYRGSGTWTASGTKIISGSFTYATPP